MASINNKKLSSQLSSAAMKSNNAAYSALSNSINSIYGTTTSPFYSFNIDNFSFEFLTIVVKYLSEEELDKLLGDVIDRAGQVGEDISASISGLIKGIVRTRHVSEEFLLKYYEYLGKSDILTLHTPDITSGGYPQLALLLMNDESKGNGPDGIREFRQRWPNLYYKCCSDS